MPKIKEIERTPNPDAMRFVLGEPLTNGVTKSYENADQAVNDEFATALFAVDHVLNVYYVNKYVTVTQDGDAVWSELLRQLAPHIREAESQSHLNEDEEVHATKEVQETDDERLIAINKLLDEQVRPYLLADGGGLKVFGLENDRLK